MEVEARALRMSPDRKCKTTLQANARQRRLQSRPSADTAKRFRDSESAPAEDTVWRVASAP
jgi:hypothetical protein